MCKIEKKDLETKIQKSVILSETLLHDEYTPQPEIQYQKGKIKAYNEILEYLKLKSNYNHKR